MADAWSIIKLSIPASHRDELAWLCGNRGYGDTPETVAEYLLARALDDLRRAHVTYQKPTI